MSQRSDIRLALERGDSLTREDIRERFGCCKGPARIAELRQEGMWIETTMVEANGKRFARWSLVGQIGLFKEDEDEED